VLVHRDNAEPAGTRRFLESRKVERHFHVRLNETSGFERLARLITGRAVGLTLGGGFARGLAHLGVFRAMADLGIAIDILGGASMGAMVGALQAMGWEPGRIREEVTAAGAGKFGDLTFPFVAFKTGRTFSGAVRQTFGDIQIEDLWTPYFCISANLNRAELRVHTQGSLAKAILAATRAPGVFPPVIYEGELHVDGGVINNVPVDLMRSFSNDGIVVGVDVSPPHELHVTPDYGDEISGWDAARTRWKHRSGAANFMPSILLVMIRTLEFTGISYKNERIKFADIYMYPDLLKFKRTDFHLADGLADAGYNCAKTSFGKWLESESAASRRPDLLVSASQQPAPAAVAGSPSS
jgi:NTE family protein/lysophospholipid hydrolase